MASEMLKNLTISDGIINGTLIITDFQTKGKGQRGNYWESIAGENLLFSVVLKCNFLHPSQQFLLNQVTSIALLETLDSYMANVKVKWPNDIYVEDKKISGILIENSIKGSHIESTIIGIGLNVNQIHFLSPKATSIKQIIGNILRRETILEEFLLHLEHYYLKLKNKKYDQIRGKYLDRLYGKGQLRQYEDATGIYLGEIVDIDQNGRLVIKNGETKNHYDFKEVKFIID
jgi:BirA family biotin operon repressor/biotin-[acetyl-CoA-carboxylase] ligase